MKRCMRVYSSEDEMISCGRTTGNPKHQKYYKSIRFSGWTMNKKDLLQVLDPNNDFPLREIKRSVRVALSEVEGAVSKLKEYQQILETLHNSKYTSADIDLAISQLKSFSLGQSDLHFP